MNLLGQPQYTKMSLGLQSPKWDVVPRCALAVVPDHALQAPSLSQDVAFAFAELQAGPVGPFLHPAEYGVTHEMQRPTIGSGNPRDKPQEAGEKKKRNTVLQVPQGTPHIRDTLLWPSASAIGCFQGREGHGDTSPFSGRIPALRRRTWWHSIPPSASPKHFPAVN